MKKLFFAVLLLLTAAHAEAAERRIALVIGNANYQTGSLPTPANDAGLIAQTLQAAGFDVTGARDLDQESLRRTFRDFLEKASSSPSDTVAYIYLSGYGLQLEGENYFVPIDAQIPDAANVPSEALRLSDYLKPLAALHLKAAVIVLDLARANPFAKTGNPLAGGLAMIEPDPNMLIAFNAAPGTVAPNESGPYSAYAEALASISREGGIALDEVFTRVRLRVNETTKGAEVPWQSSKLETPLYLFDRAPDAPPPQVTAEQTSSIRRRPIRDFDARDAYLAALDRDTLRGYLDFIAAYPHDPMARRVRAIIAARREAITWRHTRRLDTPRAYWSYLRRYPHGPHLYDARRRLHDLAAAFEPPPDFTAIEYDVPPPPPDEIIYVDRPVLVFDDPDFDFAPPPPPPVIFLPPPPVYFIDLPPPPPPIIAFVLPFPVYQPVPVWVVPPSYIAPPPSNIIYNNIHNTVVINNTTNLVTITNPQGQAQTVTPAVALARVSAPAPGVPPARPPASKTGLAAASVAAVGAAAVLAPSLPAVLAKKAAATPSPPAAPLAKPLAPGRVIRTHAPAPLNKRGAPGSAARTPLKPSEPNKPSQRTGTPAAPARVAPPHPVAAQPKPAGRPASSTPKEGSKQTGHLLPGARGGQPLPPRNTTTKAPAAAAGVQPSREERPPIRGFKTTAPRVPRSSVATKPARPAASPSPIVHARRPAIRESAPRPAKHVMPSALQPKHVRPAVPKQSSSPVRHLRTSRPSITHAPPPRVRIAPHRASPPPFARRTTPSPRPLVRAPSHAAAIRTVPHRAPVPPPARRIAPPPPRIVRAPPPPARGRSAPPPRRAPAAARPASKGCVLPNGRPCR